LREGWQENPINASASWFAPDGRGSTMKKNKLLQMAGAIILASSAQGAAVAESSVVDLLDQITAPQPHTLPAASTRALHEASLLLGQTKRHQYTGNADYDFAAVALAQHQGAVAMARAQLEYGHDVQLREIAQARLEVLSREVKILEAWLASNPVQGLATTRLPVTRSAHSNRGEDSYANNVRNCIRPRLVFKADGQLEPATLTADYHALLERNGMVMSVNIER